jgi:prophage DNA circulation protein
VKDALTLLYIASKLPATMKGYVTTAIGTARSSYDNVPNNTVQSQLIKLKNTDVESTETITHLCDLPGTMTDYIRAQNIIERSGSITPVKTLGDSAIITPYQALTRLEVTVNQFYLPFTKNTATKRATGQTVLAVETAIKAAAALEMARTVTYIEFTSLTEANEAWRRVLNALDTVMNIAANNNIDVVYQQLSDCKSILTDDIKQRAPTLNRIIYRTIPHPTPSLVIAYEEYGDTAREQEIVKRNGIRHPGFVSVDRLELIKDVS